MSRFLKSDKAIVIVALVFVLVIIVYNVYDTSKYNSYRNAYTSSEAENYCVELVNINTATVELLCTLPGIKEATAEDIISYREEHGDFEEKEDIVKVQGIGEKDYERLSSLITVE